MAVVTNTRVRNSEKNRPAMYLCTHVPLKNGDKVLRRTPIWDNQLENDGVLQAVLERLKDEPTFQPAEQTYWFEAIKEVPKVSAADLI